MEMINYKTLDVISALWQVKMSAVKRPAGINTLAGAAVQRQHCESLE